MGERQVSEMSAENARRAFETIALILSSRGDGVKVKLVSVVKKNKKKAS